MIPSVLATQFREGLTDYVETTFPVTSPIFDGSIRHFLEKDPEPHFQDSGCKATNPEIGKWGQLRSDFLVEERPGEYCRLLSDDMLDQTMIEINEAAEKRMAELVSKMQNSKGDTETLNAENRNEWVLKMNSIRARTADIVKEELIFT